MDANGYVRITDLGISREWTPENSNDTSGTPGYMAPEVISKHSRFYSPASDVFACGVVLHAMLVGYTPYHTKEEGGGAFHIDMADWRHISPEAKDLVQKMLDWDWRKRITTKKILKHPWMNKKDFSPDFMKFKRTLSTPSLKKIHESGSKIIPKSPYFIEPHRDGEE